MNLLEKPEQLEQGLRKTGANTKLIWYKYTSTSFLHTTSRIKTEQSKRSGHEMLLWNL